MKGTPTRVGVVGVGALGRHHARVYQSLSQSELIGVVDCDRERAEAVAGELGCQFWTDVDSLIPEVEAVSLAVPTRLHTDMGVSILESGCHLLVEKPIADSLQGAKALVESSLKQDCVLQVGHSERFNPALRAVIPHLGQPRFFEGHRLARFVPRSLDIDVVLDLMIHDLDLVQKIVGSPVAEVKAVGIPVLSPQVDIANARIEFSGGEVANLTASRISDQRVRKLRFFQPQEYVSIDFLNQQVEMYSLRDQGTKKEIRPRTLQISDQEPLKVEIEAFLDAISGTPSSEWSCSGEEALQSLRLALQVIDTLRH